MQQGDCKSSCLGRGRILGLGATPVKLHMLVWYIVETEHAQAVIAREGELVDRGAGKSLRVWEGASVG